ncbi:hypothetical protein CHLRE_09g401219v5 [Chlamydomonas reinhardtii]|uniref:Uncharacterized protein n=1 Tax=Chlamydomonas reinhardtii TaxID=3055 RepID=A8J7W8_CHLRE|nr:uncharacterized protein CHLRE_09g401219v5 [Chlamydomonas reinhardtii]PNW79115.1 hypothetical protein CHLRE_09g401219v5 [Chlamydomonas reinhardtii]|eukprot:XP_001697641.1 predicted protein [Chlamydomonas reinhardtii]
MVFVPPHLAAVLQAGGGGAGQQGGSGQGLQGRRAANQGCLVFCTPLAVYRLPLPAAGPSSRAHHAQRRQPSQPQLQAQLLAGVEWARGRTDGPPTVARFNNIRGLAVDAEANLYVTDECDDDTDCVRRVSFADGTVTTLVTELPGPFWWPTVLPNGYLAVSSHEDGLLIDLGLQPLLPPWPPVVEAAAGPPPRSLPGDLGALLEDAQQPGGGLMSDLVVRVGERRFPCHRLILAARCDYFKHRLLAPDAGGGGGDSGGGSGSGCGSSCGGFVDAREAEVELPDADADVFALLLRWLYTGAADIPPQQARALAVLADRLLLHDLCAASQAVVASSVSAATAVDCLLWAAGAAEARGGADGCFGWLLEELKGWYVEHHEEVKAEADESRERLAIEAPLLALRLADAVLERVGWERSAAAADRKRRRA